MLEIPSFTPSQRAALGDDFAICTLIGETTRGLAMRGQMSPHSLWLMDNYPEYNRAVSPLQSVTSQVAVSVNPNIFSVKNSLGQSHEVQLTMVHEFSTILRAQPGLEDVDVFIGDAPDYIAIIADVLESTGGNSNTIQGRNLGVYLLSPKLHGVSQSLQLRTLSRFEDQLVVVRGSSKGLSLSKHGPAGYHNIGVLPLVKPSSSR